MLSNAIKTRVIQTREHSNDFSIFTLTPDVYLSNFRLIDVGATVSPGSRYYPMNTGANQVIENVTLELDKTVAADVQEQFARYATFKNLLKSNSAQSGISPYLFNSNAALQVKWTAPTNVWGTDGHVQARRNLDVLANLGVQGGSARIDLRQYIDFLNQLPYLPYLPNLRVKVSYNNLLGSNQLVDFDGSSVTSYTINRPRLVVDVLTDVAALAKINRNLTANYLAIEYERLVIPSTTDGTTQQLTICSDAFRNKKVQDMVIMFQPQTDSLQAAAGLGNNYSSAQVSEVIQFNLNNDSFLTNFGLDNPALKEMFLNQTYGGLNQPHAAYQPTYTGVEQGYHPSLRELVGRGAYFAYPIDREVDSLELVYKRVGSNANDMLTSQLVAHIFARIPRKLVINNDQVTTSYL